MAYQASIIQIDTGTVLAECGPMRLTIQARRGNKPLIDLATRSGYEALDYLDRIAGVRQGLSRPHPEISAGFSDRLPGRMLNSVRLVGDADLTPMAAVAGTIADAVAEWVFERGATRVVVENGGDVSVRLAKDETVDVGIRPSATSPAISHHIELDSERSAWGVATSGMGGRSFTRGIASAVTVISESASLADAAATAIANACFVEDNSIVQIPAENIDSNTDLKGVNVTVGIGILPPEKMILAVETALSRANALRRQGLIIGAFIALDNVHMKTGGFPFKPGFLQSSRNPKNQMEVLR
jgi:hypothetical protein